MLRKCALYVVRETGFGGYVGMSHRLAININFFINYKNDLFLTLKPL